MAGSRGKPKWTPDQPFGSKDKPLHIDGAWVWAPLKRAWLAAKPEELVRQEFIYRLHTQWQYALEQMRQEVRVQRGRGSARADIVVATSVASANANRDWHIVVETKAEKVPINPADYGQGESYARSVGAEFLVMHNQKETSFSRLIPGAPGERVEIATIPKATELANARRLEEIRHSTTTFTRDEFQRLLFECHSILRDNHEMDPGAAFDEISKILFIKMAYERQGHSEIFTTERLAEIARASLLGPDDETVLSQLFDTTKKYYKADQLFSETDSLKVSLATFKRIVSKLEKFNLSDTGDDVKGLAFERFLGETFRGELGQFFTPRPLVEFMVDLLDPGEGEVVCDPAAGTGGFLIRVFEHVRAKVEKDVQRRKSAAIAECEKKAKKEGWTEERLVEELDRIQSVHNAELDVTNPGSRLYKVAHEQIFGTDAEARAARTSKMNMIMHGDGHGGIHYHDGLLDVNGIFEGRFDVVITNPPFGSMVGSDQLIGTTEQTRVETDEELVRLYKNRYGEGWSSAHERMVDAMERRQPILETFDIGRDPIGAPIGVGKVRPSRPTEQLFIERCLNLLKPGGRMGIVLPEGILNNPSLSWLRHYVEGRARIMAVVSVPQEVFAAAKATVKTSLVFLRRFTVEQEREWQAAVEAATREVDEEFKPARRRLATLIQRLGSGENPESVLADLPSLDDLLPEGVNGRAAGGNRRRVVAQRQAVTLATVRRQVTERDRELERVAQDRIRRRAMEATSYPVFMAEAEAAGITSTGETGPNVPNDLPGIVAAFRKFEADPQAFVESISAAMAGGDTG